MGNSNYVPQWVGTVITDHTTAEYRTHVFCCDEKM